MGQSEACSRFLFTRPSRHYIQAFLEAQRGHPFSYAGQGATREQAPAGYTVDRNRIQLGTGTALFARAVEAMRRWKMFDIGWIELCWTDTPIKVGSTVAVLAHHFGFWSLNASRIVYIVDEGGDHPEFGFAYGTLEAHAEIGEERFTVEWRPEDQTVWYNIYAFSRPKGLAKVGYPLSRSLQKSFARESLEAMRRAARTPLSGTG
ncbi:MAG TPA: DUF1990 domain-containing protein [Bryobacteraceae bacterium]|nr:DUF1990 domain-containing protein [Bryobacteraceae bacterium]